MVTLIILGIEIVFFALMTALLEYHWHRHGIPAKTIHVMRIAYYVVALACIVVMLFSL